MEKTRKLGQTEIEIAAIGYGCMGQTHSYGVVEAEEDMVSLMQYAHEVGYTFLILHRFMGRRMKGILEKRLLLSAMKRSLPRSLALWMNLFLQGMRKP